MSAEYVMKTEERRLLEAFTLGAVLGSQSKEIDIDTSIFMEYKKLADQLEETGDIKYSDFCERLGQFSLENTGDLITDVINKLSQDAILARIYGLSLNAVNRGGGNRLSMNIDALKDMKKNIESYLSKVE